MEDMYNFTIDSTTIHVVNKVNYTSYTFFIKRDVQEPLIIENLVVEVDSTNIPKASIIKYNLNEPSVYLPETNSYSLNATAEQTPIIYNNTNVKVDGSTSDNPNCFGVQFCSWGTTGGPDSWHIATDVCISENEGRPVSTIHYVEYGVCDSGSGGDGNPTDSTNTNTNNNTNTTSDSTGNGGTATTSTYPVTNCRTCLDSSQNDCNSDMSSNSTTALNNYFGIGNYQNDCNLNLNELLPFNNISELDLFLDSLIENNFINHSSTVENVIHSIRRDIHKMSFSSFPNADLVAEIRLKVPDANNALECLQFQNIRVNLEGNNTFFDWNQFGSEDPSANDGPIVIINESLNTIKVIVSGEINIGLNFEGYPISAKKLITIEIVYDYSTSELNSNLSHWYYTN
ncbi:hypothetical protein [Aurantibacter aestuarii]|uniref:Uncharacterized protein n=1 Tax=Aurantibacter aestuarii TaxID=1266046 RepID=A0A2T1NC00_9FLAO|nr:hypothetical protein [Aurantibacter aestuarii]PSG89944.1 hypothetical protein C7H52_01350 [Aurantibacter aestuarii]